MTGYEIKDSRISVENDYLTDSLVLKCLVTVRAKRGVFDERGASQTLSQEISKLIEGHLDRFNQSPSVTVNSITAVGQRKIEGGLK